VRQHAGRGNYLLICPAVRAAVGGGTAARQASALNGGKPLIEWLLARQHRHQEADGDSGRPTGEIETRFSRLKQLIGKLHHNMSYLDWAIRQFQSRES